MENNLKFETTPEGRHNSVNDLLINIYAELKSQRSMFMKLVKDSGYSETEYLELFEDINPRFVSDIAAEQITKYFT